MNSVQILGNLARDPELRFTGTGRAVASFTVATSRSYVDGSGQQKEMTSFINCVAWGKLGENVGNLQKGDRVFVEGYINTRSYETQDGQKRYVTEVVANFVGRGLDSVAPSVSSESNFDDFGSSFGDMDNKSSNNGSMKNFDEEIPF